MTIAFTKMHGAGNDYIYLDAFTETLPRDLAPLAVAMSPRNTGVGADGVIVIGHSEVAHARMQIWNADGSQAEMCGNGLRCVAKYLYDRQMVDSEEFSIETNAGVKTVWIEATNGTAQRIRVSLGKPILDAADIPTLLPGTPPINASLIVNGRQFWVTCLSLGNPHCIVIVDEPSDEWVLEIGPAIENHPMFPNRINVEFVQVISREQIAMRVWERGSGETQACGSGACAAVVAGVLLKQTSRQVACWLPGGHLDVHWNPDDDQVYLTGPAEEVFQGTWPYDPARGTTG